MRMDCVIAEGAGSSSRLKLTWRMHLQFQDVEWASTVDKEVQTVQGHCSTKYYLADFFEVPAEIALSKSR